MATESGEATDQRRIQVLPYNPAWVTQFQQEAQRIAQALGSAPVENAQRSPESKGICLLIHHVGSTSVPGLAAKPIIDILPEVTDIAAVDRRTPAMQSLGYEAMGEYGLPGRRYFRTLDGLTHLMHVHTYQTGNPEITRHLAFRDYLIAHPQAASEYQALKLELAQRFPHDSQAYQDGKHGWIQAAEKRALAFYKSFKGENAALSPQSNGPAV